MMQPTLNEHSGGLCVWGLSDRYGLGYPCEKASAGKVVDAPEGWAGIYCKRHMHKALKGARAATTEDDEG